MEKTKILVIEDEVKIANLIKKVVEMDDYIVNLSHDGKEGLIKAENDVYDLIILDVMLPGLNGLEVCRTLRLNKIKTPIIMLTAKNTVEDRIRATDAGADDYLSKPFSFNELLVKIKDLLERRKNESPVEDRNSAEVFVGENDRRKEDSKLAEFNKRIMDNVPVSIITIDKEGFMTSANKYYRNFSRTQEFYRHNIFTSKFFIRENLVKDYKKLLSDGTMVKKDYCFDRNSSGEDKYLKIIAVPLLDKEGNIEGALSMALDNTESVQYKKKLQLLNNELEKKVIERTAQLNDANKELANVLELKSMFVADVSHEMRTSLAIIQGNVELMSRGLIESNDREESYEQVFGEIRRMATMLSDMTLLSDTDSARKKMDFEKININQLISSVCKSLQVVAKEKNIKLRHKGSKAELQLVADSAQLEKMLMNLIRNAIRYNKENGFIDVSAKKVKNEIILSVQDSGIGIAEKHLRNIFERFYRVDKARSRSEGGSGLGLAICKWVAETHGGKIEVKSTVGEGSLFSVSLPREQTNTY